MDGQILVATNRNLEEAISKGEIRQDLYFRLKSLDIFLPPLRERVEDIPLLVRHYLELFSSQGRTKKIATSPEAMTALKKYHWPGNIRELKAVLERAIIYANFNKHHYIEKDDLPLEIISPPNKRLGAISSLHIGEDGIDLDKNLARWELAYIEEALRSTKGRKTEAWKMLGLNDRFALYRRIGILLKKYPQMLSEFSLVRELYSKR